MLFTEPATIGAETLTSIGYSRVVTSMGLVFEGAAVSDAELMRN